MPFNQFLPLSIPGHCSLWTSRRLLQRWRIHQVTSLTIAPYFLWEILCLLLFVSISFMIVEMVLLGFLCPLKFVDKVGTGCVRSVFSFFSSANKCLLKVATYAAQLEQYQKAIEIYEQVWWCLLLAFVICHLQAPLTTIHIVIFRSEPTQWTARSSNTARRITSSRQRSVTSA